MTTSTLSRIERICRDQRVIGLWLFGSRAREVASLVSGQTDALASGPSDVDIGVLLERDGALSAKQRVRLVASLEDLLDVPRVDLVVLNEAPPFIAVEVVQGEQIVDLAERETAEFELYALRRAADLTPFRQARTAAILEEGAR